MRKWDSSEGQRGDISTLNCGTHTVTPKGVKEKGGEKRERLVSGDTTTWKRVTHSYTNKKSAFKKLSLETETKRECEGQWPLVYLLQFNYLCSAKVHLTKVYCSNWKVKKGSGMQYAYVEHTLSYCDCSVLCCVLACWISWLSRFISCWCCFSIDCLSLCSSNSSYLTQKTKV